MKDTRTIANTLIEKRGYAPPRVVYHDVPCRECGKLFAQIRPWQVFCSDGCKKSWHANVYKRQIEELEKDVARLEGENARLRAELDQRLGA